VPVRVASWRSQNLHREYLEAYERSLATTPVPVSSLTLDTPFGKTHVLVAGDAGRPPVVAIHGKALSATMWLQHLPALTRSHRVLLVDTVGDMNRSEPSRVVRNREDVVAWLDSVLHGLDVDGISLIGHSYGAWLATTYALACPDRVKQLGILSPAAVFANVHARWLAGAIWTHAVRPTSQGARAFISGGCAPHTLAALGTSPFGAVFEQYIAGVPGFRGSMADARPCTFDAQALGVLAMPVLIVIGRDETVCDGPRSAAIARERLPRAEVVLLDDANHLTTADQPAIIDSLLSDLLAA
jgi:pimeloyl-ACP methyl ester carboxylesterase